MGEAKKLSPSYWLYKGAKSLLTPEIPKTVSDSTTTVINPTAVGESDTAQETEQARSDRQKRLRAGLQNTIKTNASTLGAPTISSAAAGGAVKTKLGQ